MKSPAKQDERFMREALRLARRGIGLTSPNPAVGAVLVKAGKIIGKGWHRKAGQPHAEIEAINDALRRGNDPRGATLYVTLEPCRTFGRTPPCTKAIVAAGIRRVVAGATDPNPKHAGKGFRQLRRAGITIANGVLAHEAEALNEAFAHWIVHRLPLVTVKAAMTLDGKIATAAGESKWITSEQSRRWAMKLRLAADAIIVGVNTIRLDDPQLTVRKGKERAPTKVLRRIVLDPSARTPVAAKVCSDEFASRTTIVVGKEAPARRVAALRRRVEIWTAPARSGVIDLRWLLRRLGAGGVTSVLVEGGGETNAAFLEQGMARRIAFFYAPKILGGRDARPAVGGKGAASWSDVLSLRDARWRRIGPDLLLTARIEKQGRRHGAWLKVNPSPAGALHPPNPGGVRWQACS